MDSSHSSLSASGAARRPLRLRIKRITAPPSDPIESDVVSEAEALLKASAAAAAPTITRPEAIPTSDAPERFRVWSRRYVHKLVRFDAAIGAVAVFAPAAFSDTLTQSVWMVAALTIVGAMVWPLTIGVAHGYEPSHVGIGADEMRPVLRAAVGVVVAGAFPAGLLHHTALLTLVVLSTPLAVAGGMAARYVMRKQLHTAQRDGIKVRRVVIVGAASSVVSLADRLDLETHAGMKVIGACVPAFEREQLAGFSVPVIGDLADAAELIIASGCDAVAVTSDDQTRHHYLRGLSWALEGSGVEMLVDPGLMEVAGPRMHVRPLVGFPLLHIEEPQFTGWRRMVKRGSDVVLTTVGLIVISPVLAAIAIAVKVSDGGPVLFKQVRVGRDGQPFTMLKFRSMVVDAEARKSVLVAHSNAHVSLFKLANDPRITRIGRILRDFSLDELPQLFNVLSGSMSLVGPRPHLDHEIAQMPKEAVRRSLVTPGLTGLWQVSGRSDLDEDQSVRLDLRYVENWSLTLDLHILWKTFFAVVRREGAL